jgi:alkanesulfonate monooxygenase SsuD/methylene tetrahydromethanopterin reductase-like flavin-dependent oxidoreductase (luciferase family)
MQVLTLGHLSRGRLELGLGAGHDPDGADHAAIGLTSWEPAERVQRFRGALEIVDRLLRGGTVTFAGRHYQVKDSTLSARCLQSPRPPLTIAGYGPTMPSLAARYADTVNTGNLDVRRLIVPGAVLAASRGDTRRLTRSVNGLVVTPGR